MSNYQSAYTGAQIDAAVGGAVRFDVAQSKTEAQKAQAQSNIGMQNVLTDINFMSDAIGVDCHNKITEISSGYYANGGTFVSNANFSHTNEITVAAGDKLYIDGILHAYDISQFTAFGIFKDSNGDYLTSILAVIGSVNLPWIITVPANAAKLIINTDYKASSYIDALPEGLVCFGLKDSTLDLANLRDLSDGSKKLKIVAGVVRNSGSGWEYINDTYHNPLNLSDVSVDSNGKLVITYSFTAKKVLSLVVCPDETFASKYTAGGSVGLSTTEINICRLPAIYGGRVIVTNDVFDYAQSTFTNASLNSTTGEIKLYHPSLADLLAKEKFNISVSAKPNTFRAVLGSQGNDYISVFIYDQSGNVVKTFESLELYASRSVNSVFVNANDVVNAGGNFWIYGVMEID